MLHTKYSKISPRHKYQKRVIPRRLLRKFPRSAWLAGLEALERKRHLDALLRVQAGTNHTPNGGAA